MPKLVWNKIAKALKEKYVDGTICKICNKDIGHADNAMSLYAMIYRHFKNEHPDILNKVKEELKREYS